MNIAESATSRHGNSAIGGHGPTSWACLDLKQLLDYSLLIITQQLLCLFVIVFWFESNVVMIYGC